METVSEFLFARGYEAFGFEPRLPGGIFNVFQDVRQLFEGGGFVKFTCRLKEVACVVGASVPIGIDATILLLRLPLGRLVQRCPSHM